MSTPRPPKMNRPKALSLAIEALDKSIQRLAVDANAYEVFNFPHGEKASKRRAMLRAARAEIINLAAEIEDGAFVVQARMDLDQDELS